MMLGSILRGAITAAAVGVALALPRTWIDAASQLWIALLVVAHVALPVAAAFWGRRPDSLSLDVGLAGVGLAYLAVVALSPDASAWLHIGLPLGYAGYAFVAAAAFAGLARWRVALRVRGLRRLREGLRAAPGLTTETPAGAAIGTEIVTQDLQDRLR